MTRHTRADGRPRIWIEPRADGAAWRTHPAGLPNRAATPGEALEEALATMGRPEAAVIIFGTCER
jgi:hypothetical protein